MKLVTLALAFFLTAPAFADNPQVVVQVARDASGQPQVELTQQATVEWTLNYLVDIRSFPQDWNGQYVILTTGTAQSVQVTGGCGIAPAAESVFVGGDAQMEITLIVVGDNCGAVAQALARSGTVAIDYTNAQVGVNQITDVNVQLNP